jgi:phosphate:Na+ symporter
MSDGLKKVAGQKLKSLLEALTRHRIVAVIVGALTTALIQSSSATTVMTVGFVNAGLLSLKQALCVVLGANIGTTITAGLVSVLAVFKITSYALPAVGVGFLLNVLGKTQKTRNLGEIIIGFGLLFLGIYFMKEAFGPLKSDTGVQQALIWLGGNPLLGILAGTVITMLLQSSSASIAMVQMLAFGGAFGADWHNVLNITIPFILGTNIGTTITAQLAALRASRNAKRAAMGHTMFNVFGVMYMLIPITFGWYGKTVVWLTPGELNADTIMRHIFFAHLIFNAFNTVVFIPFISQLAAVVVKIMPVTEA